MKKILSIVLIIAILIAGLFILTGCDKNTGKVGTTKDGVNLKLDMSHHNGKVYTSNLNLAGDQKVTEFDEEEPDAARIESEEGNYVVDVTLDGQAKEAMEEFKKTAKTNEKYTEVKYGKYSGYYYFADGDMVAEIILDTSDETNNVYLLVDVYLDDESNEEKNDIEAIFKSDNVQKLLNSVSFKAETVKNTDE